MKRILLGFILVLMGCAQVSVPDADLPAPAVDASSVSPAQPEPQARNEPQNGLPRMNNNGCKGTGRVTLTIAPMALEDLEAIVPLGMIIPPGHITPIDHQYYYPTTWQRELRKEDLVEVYAPAAGVVTSMEVMPAYFSMGQDIGLGDYRFIIHHTCTLYSIYIHLHELSPKLMAMINNRKPVEVAAGEVLGTASAFDFSLHDEAVTLPGFVIPEHYDREPWKIHTVDPYDYFAPEIRTQLLAKNIRTAEPRGGKIDYDIDGKLVGNWFVENTNGYAGVKQPDYYHSHLAFAPDAYDPSKYLVGLGKDSGIEGVFLLDGPDPTTVDVSSGRITYALLPISYVDKNGNHWDQVSFVRSVFLENTGPVAGVVVVQMLEDRKIKLETFPGKTAAEVGGFTDKAVIYER